MIARKILVATDFSEAADQAVDTARTLALQNEASLVVLHVHTASALPSSTRGMTAAARLVSDPTIQKKIKAQLKKIRARLEDVPQVETAVVIDKSGADGICRYAEKHDIDLIVVSTQGRTGLTQFLIGSTAEKVVRHAPCPVLTLRAPRRAEG